MPNIDPTVGWGIGLTVVVIVAMTFVARMRGRWLLRALLFLVAAIILAYLMDLVGLIAGLTWFFAAIIFAMMGVTSLRQEDTGNKVIGWITFGVAAWFTYVTIIFLFGGGFTSGLWDFLSDAWGDFIALLTGKRP